MIGPWYVLPDEWLVSGEALIRNLRLGLRKAATFGGGMRIGYVPDQFGHVGQLPQIFRGFGFDGAALWRGVPAEIAQTCFRWEAADGSSVFTAYLPRGYGNAALLPFDPDALADRFMREIKHLEPFARISSLLLMNGSDHLEPQPGLPAALEAAVGTTPWSDGRDWHLGRVLGSRKDASLREIFPSTGASSAPACVRRCFPGAPPPVRRRSRLISATTGCSRAISSLWPPGSRPSAVNLTAGLLDLAWRIALENHPHDSICGCSVDRVHAQMESRFQRVEEIATAQLESRRAPARRACRCSHARRPAVSGRGLGGLEPERGGKGASGHCA